MMKFFPLILSTAAALRFNVDPTGPDSNSRESKDVFDQNTITETVPTSDQVLGLFPESHMPIKVKNALRHKGLIPDLTRWMRGLSEKYWGGFGNVSDVDFWQAHQWEGSKSEFWYSTKMSAPAYWAGQPNRLNGQPLAMPYQSDAWFLTARYHVLVDGGFFKEQKKCGMVINHMTNTEWLRCLGRIQHYGHENKPEQVLFRPYAEFKTKPDLLPHLQPRAFTPYSVTLRNRTWVGFQLMGPGYVVNFVNVLNESAPFNSDGSPNIYHSAVFGEEMAGPEMNAKLKSEFWRKEKWLKLFLPRNISY